MGWAGGRFSPLLSPPLASGVVGRLPPGCCCRVGGRTGDRQAVSKPLASLLNESVFFFLLGPPGRRGKPGRRGDPGKSQVLVPNLGLEVCARPGSWLEAPVPSRPITQAGPDLPLPSDSGHCPQGHSAQDCLFLAS